MTFKMAKNLRQVREVRAHGFSTVISVIGYCEPGKKYKIEKQGEQIKLTPVSA